MSMNELEAKVAEQRELRRMAEELAGKIAATEDTLKAYMTANGADELVRPQLQDHMAGSHQQPPGQQGPEIRRPGTVPAVHQADHHPAFRRGIRKAPSPAADQSEGERA